MNAPKFLPTLCGGWVNTSHIVYAEKDSSGAPSYLISVIGGADFHIALKIWIEYVGGWRHE